MSAGFDTKERVRDAIDIVELIGSQTQVTRRGRNYLALCPFHDDSRPSLQISQEKQSWRCWVCNIGGDIFSFVMQHENVSFGEALRLLADMAGISLERVGRHAIPGSPDDKQTLYAVLRWAEQQYHQALLTSPEASRARDYLLHRGIPAESWRKYALGYAPDGWQWLLDRAQSVGHSSKVLEAAGLCAKSETSQRYYDRFRDRVLFSIQDAQRRPVGFGGRILPGASDEGAKYINSPESRLFDKSNLLYGLSEVRDTIAKQRSITVVEGYTDAIMAWQHGVNDVVAVLGTALGERHIQTLKRYVDRVTLVLDGDEAGQRRTNEVLQLFLASPIDLRIVTLPDNLDPCDFLQEYGAEAFRSSIAAAQDALQHKVRRVLEGVDLANDLHRGNQALESVLESLATMAIRGADDAARRLRQQQMLAYLARQFGVDESNLRERLDSLRRAKRTDENRQISGEKTASARNSLDAWDRELFQIMLQHPEFVSGVMLRLGPDDVRSEAARDLFLVFVDMMERGDPILFQNVMLAIEDEALKTLLVELDDSMFELDSAPDDSAANDEETRQVSWKIDAADGGPNETKHGKQTDSESQRQTISEADAELTYADPARCLEGLLTAYESRRKGEATRAQVKLLEEGELTEEEQLELLTAMLANKRQGVSAPTDG